MPLDNKSQKYAEQELFIIASVAGSAKDLRYEHEDRALLSKNILNSDEISLRTINLRGI
jgi:hypothetical protein